MFTTSYKALIILGIISIAPSHLNAMFRTAMPKNTYMSASSHFAAPAKRNTASCSEATRLNSTNRPRKRELFDLFKKECSPDGSSLRRESIIKELRNEEFFNEKLKGESLLTIAIKSSTTQPKSDQYDLAFQLLFAGAKQQGLSEIGLAYGNKNYGAFKALLGFLNDEDRAKIHAAISKDITRQEKAMLSIKDNLKNIKSANIFSRSAPRHESQSN